MLDQLFPKYHHRFTQSPAAPWLQSFADWLVAQGYAHDPAHDHVSRLRRILERVVPICPDTTFTVNDINELFTPALQEASPTLKILACGTQRAFVRFLDAHGKLVKQKESARFGELVKRYEQHLFELRGFTVSTVRQHLATVSDFLIHAIPSDMPLATLTAAAVESFVAESGSRISRQSLQHTVARLRGFLRFCYDQGELPRRLDMIDAPRTYRDELPPRALQWNQVLALLRSIDRSTKAGCRDHAMLYLMSHYGLRPSEIVALTIESVDWLSRTMKVEQCKTRSTLVLPLSDQALRMLKRYLRCGRSGGDHHELFLRNRSPAGPITHYTVCDVYSKRMEQSGLPLAGTSSYCLRHSFAMRLLERGVGVKAIGDLLGHRSLESTCVYLRLQVDALRDVALQLPSARSQRSSK
jgi:integrase/recombinase XerD